MPAARLDEVAHDLGAGVARNRVVADVERDPAAEADDRQRLAGGRDRPGQDRARLGSRRRRSKSRVQRQPRQARARVRRRFHMAGSSGCLSGPWTAASRRGCGLVVLSCEVFTFRARTRSWRCVSARCMTRSAPKSSASISRATSTTRTLAEIEAAWHRYSILLFRGVDDGRRRSTSRSRGGWGRCTSWSRWSSTFPDYPEVLVVSNVEKDNKPIGMKRAGLGLAFRRRGQGAAERRLVHPRARAAAGRTATRCTPTPTPRSRRCPTTCGARSWDAARASRRARFHEVYYPHLPPLTEEQKKARPDVWHPIARRHPQSGWTRSTSAAGRTRSTAWRTTRRRS